MTPENVDGIIEFPEPEIFPVMDPASKVVAAVYLNALARSLEKADVTAFSPIDVALVRATLDQAAVFAREFAAGIRKYREKTDEGRESQ